MNQEHKSMKNWREDEQPRERLASKGPAALSDAELLAILISSGTKGKSALELARDLLDLAQSNIRELGRLSIKDMQKVKGIGDARAITISAALELGRRRQTADALIRKNIANGRDAAEFIMPLLQDLNFECFYAIYLSVSNKIISHEKVSSGGLSSTVVDVRIVLKQGILNGASRIIVAHNHPSGNKTPSQQDISLTQRLKEGTRVMDMDLIDHIIIAGNEFFSFSEEGLL